MAMEDRNADIRVVAIALVLAIVLGVAIFGIDFVDKMEPVHEKTGEAPEVSVPSEAPEVSVPSEAQEVSVPSEAQEVSVLSETPETDVDRAIDLIKSNMEVQCFRVDRHSDEKSKIMSDIMYLTHLEIDRESGRLLVHEKQITTDVNTGNSKVLTFVTSLYSEVMLGNLDPKVDHRKNELILRCGSVPYCFRTKIDQCMSTSFQSKPECQDEPSPNGALSPSGYDGAEDSNKYNLCNEEAALPVTTALGDLIMHFRRKP